MEAMMNGLIMGNTQLPVEMLVQIFRHIDRQDLLSLQFVCKRWQDVIKKFVWHKDAKTVFQQKLPFEEDMPWNVYYSMSKMIFGRNLVRNHSGAQGLGNWNFLLLDHLRYVIPTRIQEIAARPTPVFPDDPVFERKKDFFNFGYQFKSQTIDLGGAGFTTKFLDIVQPPIEVSVWFTGNFYSTYQVGIYLYGGEDQLIQKFEYCSQPLITLPNRWNKVSYVFENYGPGVTEVRFVDTGRLFCKVAGSCVKVMTPKLLPSNIEDAMLDFMTNMREWRRKAEIVFKRKLRSKTNVPCDVYCSMSRMMFERNLVKNNTGTHGLRYWRSGNGDCSPTWEVKFSTDHSSTKEKRQNYFVCGIGPRYQDVNLQEAGFSTQFLDLMQPPIEVSVWFACNEEAKYKSWAFLSKGDTAISKEFSCSETINYPNQWRKARYVFNDYGTGVTSIRILDCGTQNNCKVTEFSVKVLPPINIPSNYADAFM